MIPIRLLPRWHRPWQICVVLLILVNLTWGVSEDVFGVVWPTQIARLVAWPSFASLVFVLFFRPLNPKDPRARPLPGGIRHAQIEALRTLRGPYPRRALGPESGPTWVWRCQACDADHADDVDRICHAPSCRWVAAHTLAWTLDLPS